MAQEKAVAKLAASTATHETWLRAPVANYESRYEKAGRPIEIVYCVYSDRHLSSGCFLSERYGDLSTKAPYNNPSRPVKNG